MSDQDDLWVPCKTIYSTLIIKTIRLSKKMDLHDYLNGTLYQPCVGWLHKKSKCKIFLISFKSTPLSNLCAAELPWLKQMPDRMCGSVPCMLHHLEINKRLQWNINHLTCMAYSSPASAHRTMCSPLSQWVWIYPRKIPNLKFTSYIPIIN